MKYRDKKSGCEVTVKKVSDETWEVLYPHGRTNMLSRAYMEDVYEPVPEAGREGDELTSDGTSVTRDAQ